MIDVDTKSRLRNYLAKVDYALVDAYPAEKPGLESDAIRMAVAFLEWSDTVGPDPTPLGIRMRAEAIVAKAITMGLAE